jgi:hypothetical protein
MQVIPVSLNIHRVDERASANIGLGFLACDTDIFSEHRP